MKWTFRLSDLYLIKKESLAMTLLCWGMFIAFLGSLNPWFLWPIGKHYIIPASLLVVGVMLIAHSMKEDNIFTRNDFLIPILALLVFIVYERLSVSANINGYIVQIFRLTVFYALFRLNNDRLRSVMDFICRLMGLLLIVSLAGHVAYLIGIPLPGRNVEFDEWYSYINHYLFLLDDRNLFTIYPRFNSYFLEPSHIGQACAFLLMSQWGKWRRWYNLTLLATVFLTFSLAAYVYLTAIVFFNQWTAMKHMFRNVIIVVVLLAAAVTTVFTYNGGDNLVHDLIMLRLEMEDDGTLAGDNRVTGQFQADYDNYIESSDILFGRNFEAVEFGNAGYHVFFYDHGIVGILLIFLFYYLSMMYTPNKRALVSVLILTLLYFWATAFMLWENIFFPLYAAAYLATPGKKPESPAPLSPVKT
jgi:ABC-type multidrug transport system fused ATPase/permease subunit